MHSLTFIFLLFIIYAFLGWCLEVLAHLIDQKTFINRGFLIGPVCPIYGFAVLSILMVLSRLSENPILIFFSAALLISIIEYGTSYLMEKLFHARWWDYSKYKYNLNGRICLDTIIPFSFLGLICVLFVNPSLCHLIQLLPPRSLSILSVICATLLFIDLCFSTWIIQRYGKTVKHLTKDDTAEINRLISNYFLSSRNILKRRLVKAFPNATVSKPKRKKPKSKAS